MDFPASVAAQLAGNVVRCDALAEIGFLNGSRRLYNGFGTLRTNDGKLWQGIGNLGSIGGLKQAMNGAAAPLELSVSGVDAGFAAQAKGDRANWYMRPVVIYLQFFANDWQPLDMPFAMAFATMRQLTIGRQSTEGGMVYSVTIQAEGPFITRKRARYGFYSDTDQQKRFPGDRGCERTSGIEQHVIIFPRS
ncbi:hypothetical protein ACLE20_15245 [Rhizobium sp. YIM 134829]|uniref:hypothetical protein n=1 Tax=Rhizobium sp. YIM 134829 TaxID=3390453 RepID=UPI00397A7ECC